jgi:hypothetical protein
MTAGLPPANRPDAPPSPSDLEERDRYATLTSESLATVRASAQTWRNGLAAFITLVTTGVVIEGRDNTAGLTAGWRIAVTVLIAGGLSLAVVGLWQALAAEAGTGIQTQTLQDIRARHSSLDAYQVILAVNAAHRLRRGRYAVVAALACLLAGVVVTWWAPGQATASPAYVKVTYSGTTICGTLQAAGHRQLELIPFGAQQLAIIPFTRIVSLTLTTVCS